MHNLPDAPNNFLADLKLRLFFILGSLSESESLLFSIFNYIWTAIFLIPNIIETAIQSVVLNVIYATGKTGEFFANQFSLHLLWIFPGILLGVTHLVFSYIFLGIESILTLPTTIIISKKPKAPQNEYR